MIDVEVSNQQAVLPVDEALLREAVTRVCGGEGVTAASVSLAVVDDPVIHQLNRQYLRHDYATDVLSFLFEDAAEGLEGEVVVSAETALRQAPTYGGEAADELLLYVVHGVLHLLGYDDHDPEDIRTMREKERFYLAELGRVRPEAPSPDGRAPDGGPTDD